MTNKSEETDRLCIVKAKGKTGTNRTICLTKKKKTES